MSSNLPQLGRAAVWQARWRMLQLRAMDGCGRFDIESAVRVATQQGFVLTRAQAHAHGVDDLLLRRLTRRRIWQVVARGVLTVLGESALSGLDAEPLELDRVRHALRCGAAAVARPDHVVCGRSAAILHGLPVLRTPDEPIITARPERTLGLDKGVLVRRSQIHPTDEAVWFGIPVTDVARTVADLARLESFDGIMAADLMLRERLATRDELHKVLVRFRGWPGVRTARMIELLADPRAESPLESIVRLRLHRSDVRPPELQVEVSGANGRRYRADFLWPRERLVLEADGRLKYTDDQLWAEKERELALVRAGFRVERVVWADIGRGWPKFVNRLATLLTASPAQ